MTGCVTNDRSTLTRLSLSVLSTPNHTQLPARNVLDTDMSPYNTLKQATRLQKIRVPKELRTPVMLVWNAMDLSGVASVQWTSRLMLEVSRRGM